MPSKFIFHKLDVRLTIFINVMQPTAIQYACPEFHMKQRCDSSRMDELVVKWLWLVSPFFTHIPQKCLNGWYVAIAIPYQSHNKVSKTGMLMITQ